MAERVSQGEQQRDEALARLRATYRGYVASGYDERWAGSGPGMVLSGAERDAWLTFAIGPAGTVLDLGCGSGGLAVMLAGRGQKPARYIGVDLLDEHIASAGAAVPWGEFVTGSADRLPMLDATADVVVAALLFSSLREAFLQRAVAAEVARVLRPGGRLVVYDIRYPSPRNRSVVPVTVGLLERLFPDWPLDARTITLLPPVARSALGAGARRYHFLTMIPVFRSHLAAILVRP